MLTPFTTPDDVRALLGLSDIEVSDETINLPVFELGLRRALGKVSGSQNTIALFSALAERVAGQDTLTDAESAFHDAVRLYASLTAALKVGVSLPLLAPKRISDDKSGTERFSGTPYKDLLAMLQEQALDALEALQDALADLTGDAPSATTLGFTYALAVPLATDPVTGA